MRLGRVFCVALPLVVTTAPGCGSPGDEEPQDPSPQAQTTGSVAGTGGKIFIQWTLGGAAPTATSCTGIDQIELSLFYPQGRVTIAPIPCTIGRFRYDALPTGDADLRLDGLDARGCRIARGDAQVTLSETLPASPSPTVAIRST